MRAVKLDELVHGLVDAHTVADAIDNLWILKLLGSALVVLVDMLHFDNLLVEILVGNFNLEFVGESLNDDGAHNAALCVFANFAFPIFLLLIVLLEVILDSETAGFEIAEHIFLDAAALLVNKRSWGFGLGFVYEFVEKVILVLLLGFVISLRLEVFAVICLERHEGFG